MIMNGIHADEEEVLEESSSSSHSPEKRKRVIRVWCDGWWVTTHTHTVMNKKCVCVSTASLQCLIMLEFNIRISIVEQRWIYHCIVKLPTKVPYRHHGAVSYSITLYYCDNLKNAVILKYMPYPKYSITMVLNSLFYIVFLKYHSITREHVKTNIYVVQWCQVAMYFDISYCIEWLPYIYVYVQQCCYW